MATQTLVRGGDAGRWEQAIYAFLAEKERRSDSMRTVRAYSGMLYRFFGNLGKPPDQVTSPEVFGYAHGIGLSGKKPSSVTINARIACLSSFYRFLIRMSLVSSNPCDQLERPKATPAPPKGLTAADIKKLLDFIPDNPIGLRDRAIILTLILTGRRRAEVLNLKVSDLIQDGEAVLLQLPGQGWQTWQAGVAPARIQGHTAGPGGIRQGSRHHEARRVPVAIQCRQRARDHQRHLLRQPPPVLQSGGPAPSRRPHLSPLGGQAEARGRGVSGAGEPVPGPLVVGGDHGVLAAARRRPGHRLGAGC